MDRGSSGLQRFFGLRDCHKRLPRNRELAEIERRNGSGITNDSRDRFPEESRFAFREHRLIRELRNHAEAICPGDVARGENPVNTWMRLPVHFQVTKRKLRAMMRRAHDAE